MAAGHNVLHMVDAKLHRYTDFFPPCWNFFPLNKKRAVVLLDTASPFFSKPYNRADRPMGRRQSLEAGVSGAGTTAGTYARMLCNMSDMARVVNGASMLG